MPHNLPPWFNEEVESGLCDERIDFVRCTQKILLVAHLLALHKIVLLAGSAEIGLEVLN
jgi:hypothetical protein